MSILAKLGRIPYSMQNITEDDRRAVTRVLDSRWISGNGPETAQFEEALAEYTGYKYCLAVSSATAGLYVLAGVLSPSIKTCYIPALTFVATANTFMDVASVQIIDVDADKLTAPQATVPVSYAGYPVFSGMVADDAHYIYPGMAEFKFQKACVLSFHAVKPITSGEGGAILTDDEALYHICKEYCNHGARPDGGYRYGLNFRMADINAALARSQLQRAEKDLVWRHHISNKYFDGINPEYFEFPPYHSYHAWHLFVLRCRGINRNEFRSHLAEMNVLTQVHYKPLNLYEHLETGDLVFPVTKDVWENGVSIPMFSGMTMKDVDYVIDSVNKAVELCLMKRG